MTKCRLVIGLVDKGVFLARLVGTYRRLLLTEGLAYKTDNFAKRSEVLRQRVAHESDRSQNLQFLRPML